MVHMFDPPHGPRVPKPPPPITTADRATAVAATARVTEEAKRRRGRGGTILTGPLGLEEEPELRKKTLLGQ